MINPASLAIASATLLQRNQFSELRPRLRNETILLAIRGGAYLRNDCQSAVVYAENAHELICELMKYCTGDLTVAEICRMFREGAEEEIVRFIRFLWQNGFVTQVLDDARAEVLEAVGTHFDAQINFLSHCSAKPWAAFWGFRRTRLLLVGAGQSFRTCAIILLRSGLERLSVLPITSKQHEDDLQEIIDVAASIRSKGVNTSVSIIPPKHQESFEEYDLIACCMDLPYLRDLRAFEHRSTLLGRPFFPGIIVGNRGFIGPIMKPNSTGCWVCCVMRLTSEYVDGKLRQNFSKNYLQQNLPFGHEFTPCSQLANMIGAEVAFELFKALTGDLRPELRRCMQVYTADPQEAIHVDVVPHPPNACLGLCRVIEKHQPEYHISLAGGAW